MVIWTPKTILGKGNILAADESPTTMNKRLAAVGIPKEKEYRNAWREVLATAPATHIYAGAIILHPESFKILIEGQPIGEYLFDHNVAPIVKVDEGIEHTIGKYEEAITKGLGTLPDRLTEYKAQGAVGTKWRATYLIGENTPSHEAIYKNADVLAQYAKAVVDADMVPIVEPEVLMAGDHGIDKALYENQKVLTAVKNHLDEYNVDIGKIILKPSMVIPGLDYQGDDLYLEDVAKKTNQVLSEVFPRGVDDSFLSGGQGDEIGLYHLMAINQALNGFDAVLGYRRASFGRIFVNEPLKGWATGYMDRSSDTLAQNLLMERLKAAHLASNGVMHELNLSYQG